MPMKYFYISWGQGTITILFSQLQWLNNYIPLYMDPITFKLQILFSHIISILILIIRKLFLFFSLIKLSGKHCRVLVVGECVVISKYYHHYWCIFMLVLWMCLNWFEGNRLHWSRDAVCNSTTNLILFFRILWRQCHFKYLHSNILR